MITNVGDEPTSNAKVGKMPVVESSAEKIRFDVFVVDPRAGELLKEGRKIKLQEQPFRVLSLLLQQSGEVVTRDELRQELWPADTFVDFDHGLNSAVARLREALGDSAEKPRFIETVAKRGYRFIALIQANEEAPEVAESGTAAAQMSRTPWEKFWIAATICLTLVCAASIWALYWPRANMQLS